MLTQTHSSSPPRADLIKPDFDNLVHQKGRNVLLETALQCPCKSKSTNQSSTCRNCGGTGWVFINPRETRMILTAIDLVNDYRPWSEELRGTVSVTAFVEDEISIMDRITALDGESIHNEVIYIKSKQNKAFLYTTYDIKDILYIALYIGDNQPLRRLTKDVDFTIERNIITFIVSDFHFAKIEDNNITIRYKHAPQFHVIEMKRDTMQSYRWENKEVQQHLPVSAVARRSHFQLSAENLNNDRLLDNSFEQHQCSSR